ncbi:hypothetical protein DSLASN_27190 [Desulfoluna limicola]|uniref:GH16 domain-containing protein n=1 Tax=Desulfoluna limicola TaxID=2810562 RepID=A0ABM7PHN1_9BACT|nr:hypothetical protein [Desulfoluna limicola]BCS97087.1 hypothetical protein DSLASN_27190 [Desulfoluna limicola]
MNKVIFHATFFFVVVAFSRLTYSLEVDSIMLVSQEQQGTNTIITQSREQAQSPQPLIHGSEYYIIGDGFGRRMDPDPDSEPDEADPLYPRADFESLDVGAKLPETDSWWVDRSNQSYISTSSTNQRHRHSNVNIEAHMITGARSAQAWRNDIGFAKMGKVYVNLWLKYQFARDNTDPDYQIKTFRVAANVESNASTTYPDFAFFIWPNQDGSITRQYYHNHGTGETHYFDQNLVDGEWYNLILQIQLGDVGKANGRWIGWMSQPNKPYLVIDSQWPNAEYNLLGNIGEKINSFYLMNYMKCEADEGLDAWVKFYYDDIYIDSSWARVEIGDAKIYNECTHREIQYSLKWPRLQAASRDIIKIKVNQNALPYNQIQYLFVIDEDGNISDQNEEGLQGFPVIFPLAE